MLKIESLLARATERQAAIESLKEICRDIGCGGIDPDMCNNRPQHCSIIRKVALTKRAEWREEGEG